MAKKKIVREMWAIVGCSNWPSCLRFNRKDSIAEYCGDKSDPHYEPWSVWRKLGVRAVKVKVVIEEAR